jgi:hypothetical protein
LLQSPAPEVFPQPLPQVAEAWFSPSVQIIWYVSPPVETDRLQVPLLVPVVTLYVLPFAHSRVLPASATGATLGAPLSTPPRSPPGFFFSKPSVGAEANTEMVKKAAIAVRMGCMTVLLGTPWPPQHTIVRLLRSWGKRRAIHAYFFCPAPSLWTLTKGQRAVVNADSDDCGQ